MKVAQETCEESKNSHFIDPSSSCQSPNCRQRKGKRSTRRKSKEALVNPQPAAYEDIPNASSSNMPPCFASPCNVPPSFAPPSNVPQSFASPSNMSPPNVGPPNMSLPSEPVFTVPSFHALSLMSVPTNSGRSSWHQAFHNTHCSMLSQVVLTSPRLLHPTTVITGTLACLPTQMRPLSYLLTFTNDDCSAMFAKVCLRIFALNMLIRGL